MGDLTWWQTLALATGTGLVTLVGWTVRAVLTGKLVPRSVLDHERHINDLRRQENEVLTASVDRLTEVVHLAMGSPVTGRHAGSWDGYGSSAGNRQPPQDRQPQR